MVVRRSSRLARQHVDQTAVVLLDQLVDLLRRLLVVRLLHLGRDDLTSENSKSRRTKKQNTPTDLIEQYLVGDYIYRVDFIVDKDRPTKQLQNTYRLILCQLRRKSADF